MTQTNTITAKGTFGAGAAAFPLTRGFVTVVVSIIALVILCLIFAPSAVSAGALSGSLPFAVVIAIVGLGQMLVVQQGGFDLSLAGGVSLAVVIATHLPSGNDAALLPAILVALGCAVVAGVVNGLLVGLLKLNAIVATIGMNALLYASVFAISGGVPRTTTPLLAEIAAGKTLGISHSVYFAFAILIVVSFVLKKTLVGRRFEVIGANRLAARAAGLKVRRYQAMAYVAAQLHYCVAGILIAGITREPTASGAAEAALCPSITEYIYADGQGDTQKAISDINSIAARGINALVVFGDAGPAVLPAITNAYNAGTVVVPYRVNVGGRSAGEGRLHAL